MKTTKKKELEEGRKLLLFCFAKNRQKKYCRINSSFFQKNKRMNVCTKDKCCLENNCFIRKWLERGDMHKPKAETFTSSVISGEQVAQWCHAIGTIHELVEKYRKPWMVRAPSKTLAAHNIVRMLMLSIMSLWWEGNDLWIVMLYKFGDKDFMLTAADVHRCLTLPRGEPVPDSHYEDFERYQAACKTLFKSFYEHVQVALSMAGKETDKTVLETIKGRLAKLAKAF